MVGFVVGGGRGHESTATQSLSARFTFPPTSCVTSLKKGKSILILLKSQLGCEIQREHVLESALLTYKCFVDVRSYKVDLEIEI